MAEDQGLGLSRSRIATLIAAGAVEGAQGPVVRTHKVAAGEVYRLAPPPPVDPIPQPENIPLSVVHEDPHLIVVDKPAGMVVHPAPGAQSGTLVNALLHHCGTSLAGIGGERRPGIVHRIDKDTSGLLVVAKTEAAMIGLSEMFAKHDIERRYLAIAWSAPDRADPRLASLEGVSFSDGWVRIETNLGRHKTDRKKMDVLADGGRLAVSHLRTLERFGPVNRPFASLIECQLETGRTHQIRVQAAYIGHALVGDPVYGRPRIPPKKETSAVQRADLTGFQRQALHAASLGFQHPVTAETMRFEADFPRDMNDLLISLRRNE